MVLPRTLGLAPRTCYVMGCLLIAVLCCTSINTAAQTETAKSTRTQLTQQSRMHEVVVTATHPLSIMDMPRSVSVITAEDIALSAARSIPDLLASSPNITLTSFSGNEKFTRLDFRASGDTSVSNVLTLIDGIKSNTPDLYGTDFSVVSMHHIERIEVVRGANSVRFGSGASHGVLNIITQRPRKTQLYAKRERGSFASDAQLLSATVANEKTSLMLNHVSKQSDGYRQHNSLQTEDFLLQYRHALNHSIEVLFKHQQHQDEYQLPGPLSRLALTNSSISRRSGNIIEGAEGITDDRSQLLQLRFTPYKGLFLKTNLQCRERNNLFKFAQALSLTPSSDRERIKLQSINGDTVLRWQPSLLPLTVSAGLDYSHSSYNRSTGGQSKLGHKNNVGKLISRAAFTHLQYTNSFGLIFSGGYRRDTTSNQFYISQLKADESSSLCEQVGIFKVNCPITDIIQQQQNDNWHNEAFELGAVFALNSTSHLYISAARTFRSPNVDELALPASKTNTALNNPTLRPQYAERYEAGWKYDGSSFGFNLGIFKFFTHDEIIFRDSGDGLNANFNLEDTVKRSGIEFETIGYLNPQLTAGLNMGYVDAKTADGKRIPLAAQFTASANIRWHLTDSISLSHDIRHVGKKHDGNDFQGNGINQLPSYRVANAKLQFKQLKRGLTLYIAANNLYNQHYITASYSNFGYPADGRSFYGGITFEF